MNSRILDEGREDSCRGPRILPMRSCLLLILSALPLGAAVHEAKDAAELREILPRLAAGDTLKIAAGEYPGGYSVSGITDLKIEAQDPQHPPHFKGGKQAWHFSRCPGLTLRHLKCSGQSANGINLDDGGKRGEPVAGITLSHLVIADIGPRGNFDGIKASGLTKFLIESCEISGWGGQAIDLVGCSDSRITGCVPAPVLISTLTSERRKVISFPWILTSPQARKPGVVFSCRMRKIHLPGWTILFPLNSTPRTPVKAQAQVPPSMRLSRITMSRAS